MRGYSSFSVELNHLIFGHKWEFDGGIACEKDLNMTECPGFAHYRCSLCGEFDYGYNEENEEQCRHCPYGEKEEHD